MDSIKDVIKLMIYVSRYLKNYNFTLAYNLFFIYYTFIKLNELLKMQLELHCIPDEIFSFLIMKHGKYLHSFVDHNLYIFCNINNFEKSKKWYYLCSKKSKKKYKVAVIFTNDIPENNIYVSESMKLNVNKRLDLENSNNSSYFLIPILKESSDYVVQAKISLIINSHDCSNILIDRLLKKFFSSSKYLRINDIFGIDVKKYLPEVKYNIKETKLKILYFKVNNIQYQNQQTYNDGGFVVYEKSTLIQEANINSYVSSKCLCDISLNVEKHFSNDWPLIFKKPIDQIKSCIAPFLQKDIYIPMKPIFLVDGVIGSRKSQIIKITAETIGLHLVDANFSEIECSTSAQTEAKLRNILQGAEKCVPCILMLQNIHIFGIDHEGQIDERIFSSLLTEFNKLYKKNREYPIIIIATSDESEIPTSYENIFLEKISINYLEPEEIYETLSWLTESKGVIHQANLKQISKLCSDFTLADLDALVSHAIKNRFKVLDPLEEIDVMELSHDDFINAHEYMQSILSDEIGAPRVPKVYWEDIGGLADLKHEIIRRIKMPLLNIPGMNKSGILLYGPPGTGKTLLAKAVATECQIHFLAVKGPELLNMYVGQSEKNIRQVFERARSASPCIIFFDELDSLAPNRGQSGDSGGVMDRMVSQLLAEMDGLDSTAKIFIIAATNRPDLVDPALLRPGRFDKLLYVGVCTDRDSRLNVLKALTRRFIMDDDGEELEKLVGQLPDNLTGADLYSVCSNAWLAAVRRLITTSESKEGLTANDVIVKMEDFEYASKNLVPSVSKEELLRYEKLRDELSNKNC